MALAASAALCVGMSQAPASAADSASGGPSGEEWLSVQELRDLASTYTDADVAARSARADRGRHVDVVIDPRGDAERPRPAPAARGARPYTRLADVTRARYKTPAGPRGTLRITTRWATLVDGSRRATRHQHQVTFLTSRRSEEFWVVELSNADNRVRVLRLDDDGQQRIRPRSVTIARTFGADGTNDVVLSAGWLDASRVSFGTFTYAGQISAYDTVRGSRSLAVGTPARPRPTD